MLTRDDFVEMLRLFLRDSTNEVELDNTIDNALKKVVDLGFLRKLRGDENRYEVRRIVKAYVDGQWLADLDGQLDAYLALLGRVEEEGGLHALEGTRSRLTADQHTLVALDGAFEESAPRVPYAAIGGLQLGERSITGCGPSRSEDATPS